MRADIPKVFAVVFAVSLVSMFLLSFTGLADLLRVAVAGLIGGLAAVATLALRNK